MIGCLPLNVSRTRPHVICGWESQPIHYSFHLGAAEEVIQFVPRREPFPSGPCRSFRCIQVLEPAGGPICVVFLPRAFADVQVRQVPHGPSLLPSSPYPLSYSSPVCAGRCLAGPFSSGCKYAKIAMLTSKVRQMTFAAAEIDSGLSHTRVRGRNTLRGSPGPCRSCCACLQLMFSGGLPVSYSQSINCL